MGPLTWQCESVSGRAYRRSRLLRLDQVLEVLEELNLRDEGQVPESVTSLLNRFGVATEPQDTPTLVLEKVLLVQEGYLLHAELVKAVAPKRAATARWTAPGE
jgi:hypothetical protein